MVTVIEDIKQGAAYLQSFHLFVNFEDSYRNDNIKQIFDYLNPFLQMMTCLKKI